MYEIKMHELLPWTTLHSDSEKYRPRHPRQSRYHPKYYEHHRSLDMTDITDTRDIIRDKETTQISEISSETYLM
jgi:hypothetical protein